MNATFAAAAIGLTLTTPPPPQVAPRIGTYALVDGATPSPGYVLTHRDCATDGPVTRDHRHPYPVGGPSAELCGPFADTRLVFPGDYWGRRSRLTPPRKYVVAADVAAATTLPSFVVLMRGLDGDPVASHDLTSSVLAFADGQNDWGHNYHMHTVDPPAVGFNRLVARGCMLSGSPAELAALLRDCAASPHRAVRDYGRSLARLADD